MKNSFLVVGALLLLWFPVVLDSTTFVQGNSSFPNTFTQQVTAKVFDRATGTLILGLGGDSTGLFAISKAIRDTTGLSPRRVTARFTGIAINSIVTSSAIQYLTQATSLGSTSPLIAGVMTFVPTRVFASDINGIEFQQSAELLDASGAMHINGLVTNGIAQIAASNQFIFAAVAPGELNFGDLNSGIAVVRINFDSATCHAPLDNLAQTAAVAGDSGIKAKKLDPTSTEVFTPTAGTISNRARMYWDPRLERLYIGLTVTSGANPGDIARSVVVARVNSMGVLTYSNIAPDTAITATTSATQSEIVAGNTTDVAFSLFIEKINVMHTSTGFSYLIINGGNGDINNKTNYIFALPLVDTRDDEGTITNELTQGTLANKNAAPVDFKFVTPATAPGDLVQDPTISGTDAFALVGGNPVLLHPPCTLSDMVVVGDTVYVSLSQTANTLNETGILYSQAQFNSNGTIAGWTPWSKRAFPINGIPSSNSPGSVNFFDVDAVTGNIWAVGGDTIPNPSVPFTAGKSVAVTEWDFGTPAPLIGTLPISLAGQLNIIFKKGTYSVLDLDAFTRGFDGATAYRYALFGGINKVAFSLISQSLNGTVANAPQIISTDFTLDENLSTKDVLSAGTITVLEYTRQIDPLINYFLAGTAKGLYVFAHPDQTGFLASELSTVDLPPFLTGQWVKANLTGSVIDIKALGSGKFYVITFTTSATQPFKSKLYSITISSPLTTMFAAPTLIAESGVGAFADVQYFSGMQLIATTTDSSTEQIVLTTNNGIFRSAKVGGVQAAVSQTDAAWALINTALYNGIAGIDPELSNLGATALITGGPSTVWPFSIQDAAGLKTDQRGSIAQLNGNSNTAPYVFIPEPFNTSSTKKPPLTMPQITYFWTDGTRRFFIVRQASGNKSNQLMISPYASDEWNIVLPEQLLLDDAAVDIVPYFTWVRQIGASGVLLAGTNKGVVALE